MEVERDEVAVKSCSSLITTQCETLNKNDVVQDDTESRTEGDNQIQSETVETEDSCNLMNSQTCLQSSEQKNPIVISDEICSDSSQTTHDTLFSKRIANITISEQIENCKVDITESKNTNSEDIESAESTCIQYNWSIAPRPLCVATKEYQPTNLYENFTKGCQWSPDGTCLLVPSEDFRIRIYELPKELYSGQFPSDFIQTDFMPALTVKEGGLIYDACWYPFMNSWDPITCCFLSASRESPVHLWDAFTGQLRATYQPYNQVDEIEASLSVQFVNSGREIWCGFKNAVRTFDTDRPGRQTSTIQFKHDFPNMIGLVSCIRENPVMPGLTAFGTYSKCIGLYKDGPLCTFKTGSGVTQIEFSSCGMKLFSVVRKNDEFLCWDLRNPGAILYSFEGRQADTNQRIQFAITPDNKQIISGGIDGNIIVWELSEITDYENLNPKYKIKLSKDCINGTSLHRSLPIMATSSGQRQCDENTHRDNSVRLWWAS
ncbi:WD repeat-containing protein 79 [Camponotus floridanus]|uniref:WD repeat-containing protein 79 n=1 Tax=Camponotus floridanus TaxID=104421 RepID=E1ZXV1_CAMFO|nr:telomerase Cajal body protein 1 [Camponotus floridanus]EFN73982.1 WD repeat-containing protein 79 [Camponotus floridanus]EFN73983.1 WD repeat-containing protein 79 [Camponotus floridanus]